MGTLEREVRGASEIGTLARAVGGSAAGAPGFDVLGCGCLTDADGLVREICLGELDTRPVVGGDDRDLVAARVGATRVLGLEVSFLGGAGTAASGRRLLHLFFMCEGSLVALTEALHKGQFCSSTPRFLPRGVQGAFRRLGDILWSARRGWMLDFGSGSGGFGGSLLTVACDDVGRPTPGLTIAGGEVVAGQSRGVGHTDG